VHLRDPQGADLRTVAMPWDVVQTTRQAGVDRFQVNVPMDRLQAAPQFRSGATEWQSMSSRRYLDDVYKHYAVAPYWTTRASPVPAGARTDPNKPR